MENLGNLQSLEGLRVVGKVSWERSVQYRSIELDDLFNLHI